MTDLIILGNTNQYTFANSIVVADKKAKELFAKPLGMIHVLHSPESQEKLGASNDWIEHLQENGVQPDNLEHTSIQISNSESSIRKFFERLERILRGMGENSQPMIDLTNGTAFQKTLLSVAAYILDIKHQYMIDTVRLYTLPSPILFLPPDVLLPMYVHAPDITLLDGIAYLDLAEVIRYKRAIETHAAKLDAIDPALADAQSFARNLTESIKLKMQGDRSRLAIESTGMESRANQAVYRMAAASIASSVEDLLRLLVTKFLSTYPSEHDKQTMGERLTLILSRIVENPPKDFDVEFMRRFNEFMLYLRNSSTHKRAPLTEVERFKADLSVKLSFPFIEFYTDIVYPIVAHQGSSPKQPTRLERNSFEDLPKSELLYYGLDGDDTGLILEELFMASADEKQCRDLSNSVSRGISEVSKFIKDQPDPRVIVFQAGDDLLFKGRFDQTQLQEMQAIYAKSTNRLTCSIGYGRTLREVYVALKWAKATPGKNAIVGVRLS